MICYLLDELLVCLDGLGKRSDLAYLLDGQVQSMRRAVHGEQVRIPADNHTRAEHGSQCGQHTCSVKVMLSEAGGQKKQSARSASISVLLHDLQTVACEG